MRLHTNFGWICIGAVLGLAIAAALAGSAARAQQAPCNPAVQTCT